MELYTKRYNLYNYLIRDNFDYLSTNEYIYLWRNSLIILFAILIGIFLYHFNNIDLFVLFIIVIIIVFVYIIYFEVTIYLSEMVNNKHLLDYKYYYEVMNTFFTENYDFTKDDDINNNKITINRPSDLISVDTTILAKYNSSKNENYLEIKVNDDSYFQEFLRNNFFLYESTKIGNKIYISVDDVTFENKKIKIDNLFIRSSAEYKYLSKARPEPNQKYFIQNGYFKLIISNDKLTEEYYNLKLHIIEKMYYLFIKPVGASPLNPNTESSNGVYTIIIDDINAVNNKLVTSIITLKNSRTFTLLTYENSESNYLYSPTSLNLRITNKPGLINYIKTNQYYNFTVNQGIITITDINYPRDVSFLTSISYDGIYENTDAYLKINMNANDGFYNEMNRDYDSYLDQYILNGGITFINMYTNDISSLDGRNMYFNISKFFNKYYTNYSDVNPIIKEIPIIKSIYNSLYLNSLAYTHQFKNENPGTGVANVPKPIYDSENGIVTFKTGTYLTIPKINTTNNYSFSFWFKTTDNRSIVEYVSNDNLFKFRIKKGDNNLIFDINIGEKDKKKKYAIFAKDLNFNQWQNVIIIMDLSNSEKSKISLYVNGKLIETKELFFFIALAIAAAVGASQANKQPNYDDLTFTETKIGDFNGEMKDFRIYNRKLNDDDVKNLYSFDKGIVVNNDFIRTYKDVYVYFYQKTSHIISKEGGKLIINKRRLNEFLSQQIEGKTINSYLSKIKAQLDLYERNIDIINKKTAIIASINNNPQVILSLTLNNITDQTINENRNSFIRDIIFNRLIPFVNEKTKEYTIKEVIDGITANQGIHLKLNYSNIYNNRNKLEFENTYIYGLLNTIATEIEVESNSNYWDTIDLINGVTGGEVYLRIKMNDNNFKEESLNKRGYFNHYIYDLMERINYGERINNKFLEQLSKSDAETFKILLGYYNIRHKIKANIRFIENKSYDEINFNNYRKDILKFIDIYNDLNIKVIKDYLFLREDTKVPNIETYQDDRKVFLKEDDSKFKEEKLNALIKEVRITGDPYKYYLINIDELNKIDEKESDFNFIKPFVTYLNDKYQLNIKNLNDFYKDPDVKLNDEIAKIIENYNYIYIKIIITILILATIIFHVFYQEFIKYIR